MDFKELYERVLKEEEELRFTDFTGEDAFELGKIIISNYEKIGSVCFEIHINGHKRMAFYPDNSSFNNSMVMDRKRRVVDERNMSSLRMFAFLNMNGKKQAELNMPADKYCTFGGGFPIRLKSGTIIGSVTTSCLDHLFDHEIITTSIRELLAKK